jgi:C-terminal processing protease CtpA/Prc
VWHFADLPRIAAVTRGGAAAEAGVQEGDTIVLVDSLSILSAGGARRFSTVRPGDRVHLTLKRGAATVDATLELGRAPPPPPPVPSPTPQERRYSGEVGGASVEVWSAAPIAVVVDSMGALVIQAGASTVRVSPQAVATAVNRAAVEPARRP